MERMGFEFPKELRGDLRRDLDGLWNDVWRTVEKLRIMEELLAAEDGDAGSSAALRATDQRVAQIEAAMGNVRAARIPIGAVDAGSTATAMTATVPGITSLEDGTAAYIRNGVVTSASGWTLNVNGLGAKPVYNSMAAATRITTTYNANYTFLFVYNSSRVTGGCWDMYYGYNANDNTLAYQVRTERTARTLGDRLSRYMFVFTQRDGTIVPSYTVASGNGTTATTKTLNTGKAFDPFLPIFYYNGTTNVPAGSQAGGVSLYRQYHAVEMRYAFNAGTTLQACKPCYVRCSPNADGTVQLDGNDCLVQDLPSTEDGKVYIWLGMAYGSAGYNMELDPEHPVFEYKNGSLQRWYG